MRILICPDKFKGSLTAEEVCTFLAEGIKISRPEVEVITCPLADGGDGSLEVISQYRSINKVSLSVQDPLGRAIKASYGLAGNTAFIELSSASGLVLLGENEKSPMVSSTFGTGQMILDALQKGCKEIYLFIGGSATNDGGIGIAAALGYDFYDFESKKVEPLGKNLSKIDRIESSRLAFDFDEIDVKVICDVDNPLAGPHGAAKVYAPQKGASEYEIQFLDEGLKKLSQKWLQYGMGDVASIPGAGAAGGVGGGAIAFMKGKLQSGTDTFIEISKLKDQMELADLIITGEGKLDQQTAQGKLISGVAKLATELGKDIIGICGDAEAGIGELLGFRKVYTIMEYS
ncbi:MAG: glycerate kinase, partial [Bacteroidia bacterium]|nr:glycerate kinase [Bacteroidia bacterium]